MDIALINTEVEILKMRSELKIKHLQFLIYLEEIKFNESLFRIEMRNNQQSLSYKLKKDYFYSPQKSV